jgi:hypothetical protein
VSWGGVGGFLPALGRADARLVNIADSGRCLLIARSTVRRVSDQVQFIGGTNVPDVV